MNRSALSHAQFGVRVMQGVQRQTASIRAFENRDEASGVIVIASVEAKNLLVDVGVEMEWARCYVRPMQRPLEARPEVFNRVRMNATFAVRHPMVDERVGVADARKAAIDASGVAVDRSAWKHVCANMREQRGALAVARPKSKQWFFPTESRRLLVHTPSVAWVGQLGGTLA